MPAPRPAPLPEAFGLRGQGLAQLIGGGGKTSLMFALARDLAAAGHSVLTTTTTRIRFPEPGQSGRVLVAPFDPGLIPRLQGELLRHRHVTAAPTPLEAGSKLAGFPVDQLDRLVAARVADWVLVEADGAAGRPLKAHAAHEPVLSALPGLVLAVVGIGCLGRPLDDLHVHRAALFAERLGRAPGSAITAADVAAMFFHPEGYLRRVGRDSEVAVFLSQARTAEARAAARPLAQALRARDREGRVARMVIGDLERGPLEAA
jgi:probable selenium-dependent hydroxylase accessory protein YqeC